MKFEEELKSIENPGIRSWTSWHIERLPNHFWTDPASFSGKYHNGESRVEHVKKALKVGEELIRLYSLDMLTADQVRSAILLHDGGAYNDGGHVNVNHAQAMADLMEIQEVGKPLLGPIATDIIDAVRYHMSWWGTDPIDWRYETWVTQIVVLADYISTRKSIKVEE